MGVYVTKRFLSPKLHVRLVLEKWAWHIRALLQPRISLQPLVRIPNPKSEQAFH